MNTRTFVIGTLAIGLLLYAGSAVWAADKPIVIRYADHGSISKYVVRANTMKAFGDEVEKRSGGRVKFEYNWSESLCKAKDAPDAVRTGVADASIIVTVYYPPKFPAWTVVDVAGIFDPYAVGMAMWELNDTEPAFQKTLDSLNARMLLPTPLGETVLFFRKPVTKLKDIKGLKVRAIGSEADFINGVGGVPVPLPHPEVFLAVQRGTIDGVVGFPPSAMSYGYHEITTHWLRGIPGNFCLMVMINKDTWNKIPKDLQQMMNEVARGMAKSHAEATLKNDNDICDQQKARGAKITNVSQEDTNTWKGLYAPLLTKWKADMSARGIDGDKILQKYTDLTKKYGAKY